MRTNSGSEVGSNVLGRHADCRHMSTNTREDLESREATKFEFSRPRVFAKSCPAAKAILLQLIASLHMEAVQVLPPPAEAGTRTLLDKAWEPIQKRLPQRKRKHLAQWLRDWAMFCIGRLHCRRPLVDNWSNVFVRCSKRLGKRHHDRTGRNGAHLLADRTRVQIRVGRAIGARNEFLDEIETVLTR